MKTMAHLSHSARAVAVIFGSNTQDDAQAKMKEMNMTPHYNPYDTTLETEFDTAFKDAVCDHDLERFDTVVKKQPKVIVKDVPFKYSLLSPFAGKAGAIEFLVRSSNA